MTESLGKELFRRRVPQIVGVYLAAGWAVLEFTDFLVNRYVLSPNLTDLALLAWGAMVPTILLLAWGHGAPGRDRWTVAEKIGIPINVALAALLVFVLFQGKDLGAATTSVTVETEEGDTVERVIPKSEFRKHVALFFFDNESADSALDWLQYGMTWGLMDDLSQDVFLDVQASLPTVQLEAGMTERLREAGYEDGLRVPFALKRRIAEELHRDHFVTGSLQSNDGQLTVKTQLYETSRGKLLEERTYTGDDPFALIDRISVQLRLDLEVPSQHVEETRDLPLSELHTQSAAAYRARVEALRAATVEGDWSRAAGSLELAVSEDPTYALAQLLRFATHLYLNDMETATQALQSAMEHSYKLPERAQFVAKANYYAVVRQEVNKAEAVAGMWSELYPDDIAAHAMLAQLHVQGNERERAIDDMERILELDPGQYDVLRSIGDIHLQLGEFDEARKNYQRYADQFPDDPRSFTSLGDLSTLTGDHEAAKDYYERASVLDPENPAVLSGLGWAEYDLGNLDLALDYMEDALAASTTPAQRSASYDALRSYQRRRGHARRAVEEMHRYWAELRASQPPLTALLAMSGDLDTYVDAGMTQAALDTMSAIKSRLQPPLDLFTPIGDLEIALALEDSKGIEATLPRMDKLIEGWGLELARFLQVYGGSRLLELQGDCQQAIIGYQRALELQPTSTRYYVDIGRCQRKLGDFSVAEASLKTSLNVAPYNALAHLELAKVYMDMGDQGKAIEQLAIALRVWEDADPTFKPAQEARALLESLRE